jgi:hypothetical protein
MVEFALIAPTFFLLMFGIVEFGILMFDVAASRFAAGEAARTEAVAGNLTVDCSSVPGCIKYHIGTFQCDADCQAVMAINQTAVGTTSLEKVNYVMIRQYACNPVSGSCLPSNTVCLLKNLDDSAHAVGLFPAAPINCLGYPSGARSTTAAAPEYLSVTINFTYNWKTGLLAALAAPPRLDSTYLIRVEPQKF